MKFSLHIPLGEVAPGEFQTMSAVTEMSRALEAANVDACYVTDHPAPESNWLHEVGSGHDAPDPFTALAFVAATTTKLRLHTNIIVLPYRNPFITAKAATTLQVLSGGRLILGIGNGYQKREFAALGVEFQRRGALTDEALEVLRLTWAGGPVTVQGGNFNAVAVEPRPAPHPQPTVWIGGASDKALRRAVRWGDGWSPYFASPIQSANRATAIQTTEELSEKVRRLKDMRAEAGKTGPFDFMIGARPKGLTRGDTERLLEEIGELKSAGMTWTFVNLKHTNRIAYLEAVQWFGEEVVPRA